MKLLSLFLQNPGTAFYIREIVRTTGENINAVRRELANLESFDLVTGRKAGKQVYYSVNTDHFLFVDLQRILIKTEGMAARIRTALEGFSGITCAFLYGSFAQGTAGPRSDIDLFIVGTIGENELIPAIHECEEETGREINYSLMSPEEFRRRKNGNDPFVRNVLNGNTILVAGGECGA